MKPSLFLIVQILVGGLFPAQPVLGQVAVEQKASRAVHEAAAQDKEQEVFVDLDESSVVELERRERSSRKLQYNDADIIAKSASALSQIKRPLLEEGLSHGVSLIEDWPAFAVLKLRIRNRGSLEFLLNRPEVLRVREELFMRLSLAQSMPLIGLPSPLTAAKGSRGTGSRIVVVDTGADLFNPFWSYGSAGGCTMPGSGLLNRPQVGTAGCRIYQALDFTQTNAVTAAFVDLDPSKHGTNVAGIAGSVADGASLELHNVFSGSPLRASTTAVNRSLQWVLDHLWSSKGPVAVVNMSMGDATPYATDCPMHPYASPISRIVAAGVPVVVAAGNDGFASAISGPACIPGTVRVGAVYDADGSISNSWILGTGKSCSEVARKDAVTCFSNSAWSVTAWAPGATISFYDTLAGGTSQSAPHMSGALATLRSAYPSESATQLLARITTTGQAIRDTRNGVTRPRVNLSAAIAAPSPLLSPPGISTEIVAVVSSLFAAMHR